MKIAITGTIASGKSEVSNVIAENYPLFDCDKFVSTIYDHNNECLEAIKKLFPDCLENGLLSKKKIARIVFNDAGQLRKLEDIIYPYIRKNLVQFMNENEPLCFAETPVLFEHGWEDLFDKVIVVTCSKDKAIERCMMIRGYSYEEACRRYDNQLDPQIQIAKADYVIYNEGTLDELAIKVNELIKKIKEESWN